MDEKIFVLEIGRPIRDAVIDQLGGCDDYVSVPRAISEIEIPEIVAQAYNKIMKLGQGGNIVKVVLSGPLALSFELGQAIGFSHVKVEVYQWSQGRYVKVPPLTREHLFKK